MHYDNKQGGSMAEWLRETRAGDLEEVRTFLPEEECIHTCNDVHVSDNNLSKL